MRPFFHMFPSKSFLYLLPSSPRVTQEPERKPKTDAVGSRFFLIGGNTSTINSFTGLEAGDLSGGAFDAATLLQGKNLMCFALQVAKISIPDILKLNNGGLLGSLLGGLGVGDVAAALANLNSLV